MKKEISRRNALALGASGLAGIVVVTYGVHELLRAPTYEEALFDPSKRQAYAESLLEDKPNFIDIQYGFQGLDKKISQWPKRQRALVAGEDHLATTIPYEFTLALAEDNLGMPKYIPQDKLGTRSIIVLTDECFSEVYKRASKKERHDMDLFVRNVINSHERLHALHHYSGIPQYDLSNFRVSSFKFTKSYTHVNSLLCHTVRELLAYQAEYCGLKAILMKEQAGVLSFNIGLIREIMLPYYQQLFDPGVTDGTDQKFIERLRQELNPDVLLRQ